MTMRDQADEVLRLTPPAQEARSLVRGPLWAGYDHCRLLERLVQITESLGEEGRAHDSRIVTGLVTSVEGWSPEAISPGVLLAFLPHRTRT